MCRASHGFMLPCRAWCERCALPQALRVQMQHRLLTRRMAAPERALQMTTS